MTNASIIAPVPPIRLDALTGIRGIAAWIVVIFHLRVSLLELLPSEIFRFFSKGYLAVDLFFVLSGFVMWINYGEKLRRGGLKQVWPFLWKRFARVWPLHGFILALFIGFATFLLLLGTPSNEYLFAELPLHFVLMQNWGFTQDLNWNYPSWSISTEFAAYFVFPFIVFFFPWERLTTLVLIGLGLMLCWLLDGIYSVANATDLGGNIPELGLWRCLIEFSLGILACLVWQKWNTHRFAVYCAFVTGCVILIIGIASKWQDFSFLPAVLVCGILALAFDRGIVSRLLSTKFAVYLGEISYSTYLSHALLFTLFKIAFVGEDLQVGLMALIGFLALLAVVSVALYHWVERPAQRWLNQYKPGARSSKRLEPAE